MKSAGAEYPHETEPPRMSHEKEKLMTVKLKMSRIRKAEEKEKVQVKAENGVSSYDLVVGAANPLLKNN